MLYGLISCSRRFSSQPRDEALRRINSQMSQEEKQKFADYLIDTSDGFELTRSRSVEIYNQLIRVIRG